MKASLGKTNKESQRKQTQHQQKVTFTYVQNFMEQDMKASISRQICQQKEVQGSITAKQSMKHKRLATLNTGLEQLLLSPSVSLGSRDRGQRFSDDCI